MRALIGTLALAVGCACAPTGVPCELEVRATVDPAAQPGALERAAESLRIRLEPVAGDFQPRVRVADERTLVVEIAREPDEREIEELRALIAHVPAFGVAMRIDDATFGADIEAELARLDAWWSAHPNASVEAFNRTRREAHGPAPGLKWVLMDARHYSTAKTPIERCWPCSAAPEEPAARLASFSAADLASIETEVSGEHSFAIELGWKPERGAELRELLEPHPKRHVCWIVDGEIVGTQQASDVRTRPRVALIHERERHDQLKRSLCAAIAAGAAPAKLELTHVRPSR